MNLLEENYNDIKQIKEVINEIKYNQQKTIQIITSINKMIKLGFIPAILNQLKKLACKKYIIKNIKHKLTIDITFFRLFTSLINLF